MSVRSASDRGRRRCTAGLLSAALSWAGAVAAQPNADTYDFEGSIYEGEPLQMELRVEPDARISGYFFVESVKRPRILQGRLDRQSGRVSLTQFDQRCNPVARLDGVLANRSFVGSWTEPHAGAPVRFELSERPHPLRDYDGRFRCELLKGQFNTRLELDIRGGRLGQFTYLTNFVGGKDERPWYCAVNSVEPNFESSASERQIVLREAGAANGCSIDIRDTGNLLKIQFHACNAFCQRTAFPHSLLIDKRSGRCAEFAVPAGRCPDPN